MSNQTKQPLNVLAHIFQAISIILFFTCLSQKAYYLSGHYLPVESFLLLVVGVLGPFYGIFAWFANPFLLISYIFFYIKRFNLSILFGFFALLLICSFFLTKTIIAGNNGAKATIINYGLGFWLWMASSIIAIAAGCFGKADNET